MLGELKRGHDDLAERVNHLEDDLIEQLEIDESVANTLAWILQQKGIGQADALQISYAVNSQQKTIIYMRDTDAERVAAGSGVDIRTHAGLVADMVKLHILTPAEAKDLKKKLDAHFSGRRKKPRLRTKRPF